MSCSRTQHGDPSEARTPTFGSGVRGVNHQATVPLGYSDPLSSVRPSVHQHFQMASSLKPQDRFNPKFIYSPYGTGNESLFVKFWSCDKDCRHAHIVKHLQNRLQNNWVDDPETWHVGLGIQAHQSRLDPHQKQYDVLSFGGGDIIRSRLADWSLRYPCYNVYTTEKGRTADHWL